MAKLDVARFEVTDSIVQDDEIASIIEINVNADVDESTKESIKNEVGNYLIEQTLLNVAAAKSPISGEAWKKSLNPEYKKLKESAGGTGIANLEANGDLMTALGFETTDTGIKLFISGDQAPKADGHNNFSGDSLLPQRRFLPDAGQEYKRDIKKGVDLIIADVLADAVSESIAPDLFESVETSRELYSTLGTLLGIDGKANISRAVLGNAKLVKMLDDLDLLDLM